MGFKTKWNRFWTLRGSDGGFTLVELVVVIAILAILAGVAVPAYNTYIEKANQAADMTILSAVNTAFVAACLENGIDPVEITEASIRLSNGAVYGISTFSANTDSEAGINEVSEDFDFLYIGNENAAFKTEGIQSLLWDTNAVAFTLSTTAAPARVQLSNGNYVTVSAADVQALANSGVIDLGYEGMADIVNDVYGTGEVLVTALGSNEEYFTRLSNAMVANGLMDETEAEQISLALRGETSIYSRDEAMTRAANALTLCGAIGVAESDVDTLMDIDFGNNVTGILNAYTDNGGTAATAAMALQYGVAANYAAQNPNDTVDLEVEVSLPIVGTVTRTYTVSMSELQNGNYSGSNSVENAAVNAYINGYINNDPAAFMSKVQNANGYEDYKTNGQYENDVNGMAAALGILGDNVSDETNVNSVINVTGEGGYLENGIESEDTKELINTVLETAKKESTSTT